MPVWRGRGAGAGSSRAGRVHHRALRQGHGVCDPQLCAQHRAVRCQLHRPRYGTPHCRTHPHRPDRRLHPSGCGCGEVQGLSACGYLSAGGTHREAGHRRPQPEDDPSRLRRQRDGYHHLPQLPAPDGHGAPRRHGDAPAGYEPSGEGHRGGRGTFDGRPQCGNFAGGARR